jgi:hypothetical protein
MLPKFCDAVYEFGLNDQRYQVLPEAMTKMYSQRVCSCLSRGVEDN